DVLDRLAVVDDDDLGGTLHRADRGHRVHRPERIVGGVRDHRLGRARRCQARGRGDPGGLAAAPAVLTGRRATFLQAQALLELADVAVAGALRVAQRGTSVGGLYGANASSV